MKPKHDKPAKGLAWHMASVFRQLDTQGNTGAVLDAVRRVEDVFRSALGVKALDGDALVVLGLAGGRRLPNGVLTEMTEPERAGIHVIRECLNIRETFERTGRIEAERLSRLVGLLHDADPDRILGLERRAQVKTFAEAPRQSDEHARWRSEAKKLRATAVRPLSALGMARTIKSRLKLDQRIDYIAKVISKK